MPKRWISLRGRGRSQEPGGHDHNGFHFRCPSVEPPQAALPMPRTSSLAYRTQVPRPQTASGAFEDQSIPTFHIDTGSRPQTAEGTSPLPSQTFFFPATPKNDLIGLAFGSPTHPPTQFYGMLNEIGPAKIDCHAFEQYGPFPDEHQQRSKRKWKLGGFFKPRTTPKISEPFYRVHLDQEAAPVEAGLPTSPKRSMSESGPNPPPQGNEVNRNSPQIDFQDCSESPTANPPNEPRLDVPSCSILPKLQVEIPSAKMDRYTVMFSKVTDGQNTPNLLARRSKTLERLSSEENKSTPLPAVPSDQTRSRPRHRSSPGASRKSSISTSRSLTPSAFPKPPGGFSLFPNTSTISLKAPKAHIHTQNPLKRSVTSPARLSPAQETFDLRKPSVNRESQNQDQQNTSPEGSTASTEQNTPWSAGTHKRSESSVTTIDDDILFDIKSLRDSHGAGGHFEMTRPTSTAVALYRTMSHNLKARAPKLSLSATISSRDSIAIAGEFLAIDETIAFVEKLTQGSGSKAPRSPPANTPAAEDMSSARVLGPLESPPRLPNTRESPVGLSSSGPARTSPKAHVGNLLDGSLPSKETEKLREDIADPDHEVKDETGINYDPNIPPPVPAKDGQFIPISKFSRRTGQRSSKQARSMTDPEAMSSSQRSTALQQQTAKPRSNTTTGPRLDVRPIFVKPTVIVHQPKLAGQPMYSAEKPAMTTTATIVHPVAEVSVARTVSLSRKRSQRVLVPGRKGVDNVNIDQDLEEEKEPDNGATRMELLERKPFSPEIVQGDKGHRVGKSVHAVIENA